MSVTNSEVPCVFCESPVITDDTEDAMALNRGVWAHRTCAETERKQDPCDGCAGKGWRWAKGAKCEDDGEDCPDCYGTGVRNMAWEIR